MKKVSNKIEKYIVIDTTNLIQCCILEIDGDTIEVLKGLHEILDGNQAKLLLPEVIELEFNKVLINRKDRLKKNIGKYIEQIKSDSDLHVKIKDDLTENLRKVLEGRLRNAEEVTQEIQEIFNHKNTIKIPLSPEILLESYKLFLSGKKPYKNEPEQIISPDALILMSLKSYLSTISQYELLLCSANKKDFSDESNIGESGKLPIHPEIKTNFNNMEYYQTILELMNEKFNSNFSQKEIESMKVKSFEDKKNQIVSDQNDTDLPPSPSPEHSVSELIEELIQDSISGKDNN